MNRRAYLTKTKFQPSVFEVVSAEKVFIASYKKFREYRSKESAIRLALSNVWMAGGIYKFAKMQTNNCKEEISLFYEICKEVELPT